jgi:hypothetical protein
VRLTVAAHRVHGRDSVQHRTRNRDRHRGRSPDYDYVHAAVDDHTRLAYAEVLADERGATSVLTGPRRTCAWRSRHNDTAFPHCPVLAGASSRQAVQPRD